MRRSKFGELIAGFCLAVLHTTTLNVWGADAYPRLTIASAQQLLGKNAELELDVVEVKYAQRRKLHFLSGSANFRAADNLSVAIPAESFANFEKAGIKDLSGHYLRRKLRARGKVKHDEGQWLLVVDSPDAIKRLDPPAASAENTTLKVVNSAGKEFEFKLPFAADMANDSVATEHDGKAEKYTGIRVAALLDRADETVGAEARGKLLGRYVVVKARDGYAAVFSLSELDPFFVEKPPILAQSIDGGPLPKGHGPLQIVIPADQHRRRWVFQVEKIEVVNALDAPRGDKQ